MSNASDESFARTYKGLAFTERERMAFSIAWAEAVELVGRGVERAPSVEHAKEVFVSRRVIRALLNELVGPSTTKATGERDGE